ncbi:hypothetical protein [Kutzneria sp. NPDC052558]|uniref:hypothetical protein n=1 Tax=Kutzneria sp. NPDC052558 TaxID=3364121 RepID=UPI0037C6F1C2
MSPNALEKVRLDILDDLSSCLRSCHDGHTTGIAAFGVSTPSELALRLAGALYVLTRLHEVDDRGRCLVCRPDTLHTPSSPALANAHGTVSADQGRCVLRHRR